MDFNKPPNKNELENSGDNWAAEAANKDSAGPSKRASELVAYAISVEEEYREYVQAIAYYERVSQREVFKEAIDWLVSEYGKEEMAKIIAIWREKNK
jgi:hypothetical protein